MTKNKPTSPTFTWIVLLVLGCLDLVRGVMHTVMVKYAAPQIAGLDLTHAGQDQMFLLGVFGISNYLTGVILILIALKARNLVLTILAVIPAVYLLGNAVLTSQVQPQSAYGGRPFMMIYFAVCAVTFMAGVVVSRRRKNAHSEALQ